MFNQSSAISQSLIRLTIGLLLVFMIHISAGVSEYPTPLPSKSGLANVKAAQAVILSDGDQQVNGRNPSNQLGAASLLVDYPDLYVNKHSAWNEAWQIEYVIHFGNDGDQAMTADIIDTLPAAASWTGEWDITGIALNRVGLIWSSEQIHWTINDLAPGEVGEISFLVDVDSPGEPLIWYTNVVEIEPLADDLNPADNYAENVIFSGGEVREVHHWLNPWGSSAMWGKAVPGLTVTVTTSGDEYFTVANPSCGGCWNIDVVGNLEPGDAVRVEAGAGVIPVDITIPDPFTATVDTTLNTVAGEIGG